MLNSMRHELIQNLAYLMALTRFYSNRQTRAFDELLGLKRSSPLFWKHSNKVPRKGFACGTDNIYRSTVSCFATIALGKFVEFNLFARNYGNETRIPLDGRTNWNITAFQRKTSEFHVFIIFDFRRNALRWPTTRDNKFQLRVEFGITLDFDRSEVLHYDTSSQIQIPRQKSGPSLPFIVSAPVVALLCFHLISNLHTIRRKS